MPEQVQGWINRYQRAWRSKDADAAAGLFTETGVYRSHPFRRPHVGRAAIRAYWEQACRTQQHLELRFGAPIIERARVAVEWWATGVEQDGPFTLPGCLLLRFDDGGLCEELREYWHLESERREPPDGWGA